MQSYYPTFIILLIALFLLLRAEKRKRRIAAITHIRKFKKKTKEVIQMEELAKSFIGKDCLIYTVASDSVSVKGTVKEVINGGILVECDGNTEALNLEYVTRIREWPRNSKGKKKTVFS